MDAPTSCCIIGAGYAGLGVARALAARGIPFDWFERNDALGGNWLDGVYDSTHIISSRDSTAYADLPMPRDYPDFPSRAQVLDYLNAYADRFDLRRRIRFGATVERVTPAEGGRWTVALAGGEARAYEHVVVCNGHHWAQRIPSYPGSFAGKAIHSKAYRNPGDLDGRRVLVVGGGNSGCDIAVEAARHFGEAHVSMRRGYWFLPKTIFGIPTAELERPWLPTWAQKAVLKALLAVAVGPNRRYGLAAPDHDLFDLHPVVNSQLLYFLRHGLVRAHPDIARLDGKTVHFVDGGAIEVDTIVWATGFHVRFPFLDPALLAWENGVPRRVFGLFVPGRAGLYLFGLLQPRGGAGPLISAAAELVADAVEAQAERARPIADELAALSPPSARMLAGVHETLRDIRRARRALGRPAASICLRAHGVGGAPNDRPAPAAPRAGALDGKRVLVTGAAGAIGSAACDALRRAGARVVGLDRRPHPGGLVADLRDAAAVRRAVEEAVARLGGLDVLVNNAGVGAPCDAGVAPDAAALAHLDVNLLGAWRATAAALPSLVAAGGRVVNVASLLAGVSVPFAAGYAASKRALAAWSDALRMEYGQRIAVTTVYPGYVKTPIHDEVLRAGLSFDGLVGEESVAAVARTIVRAASGRPRRDLATSWRGAVALVAARLAPSLVERIVTARVRRAAGRGSFDAAPMATGLRERMAAAR